jgi:aminopeptidase N
LVVRLNEGFARLYENVLNDIVFPEKNQWETFLTMFFDTVLDFDVRGWMEALNTYAETREEITRKFSFSSYNKGAVVLRMLKDAITEEVFTNGV